MKAVLYEGIGAPSGIKKKQISESRIQKLLKKKKLKKFYETKQKKSLKKVE